MSARPALPLAWRSRQATGPDQTDLVVSFPETTISSASVEVHWGLSPAGLDKLRGINGPKPLVLVATARDDGKYEERCLCPLDDGRVYVPFRHAGDNVLLVALVWGKQTGDHPYSQGHDPDDWLIHKNDGSYGRTAIGKLQGVASRADDGWMAAPEILVEIPAQVFAPRPWDYAWVNLWFGSYRAYDECDFRRRRFLAYTIQPPVMLGYALATWFLHGLGWLALKLLGMRGIRPVQLNPMGAWGNAPWEDWDLDEFPSAFMPRLKNGWRFWPGMAVSPLVWGTVLGFWWLISTAEDNAAPAPPSDISAIPVAMLIPFLVLFAGEIISFVGSLIGKLQVSELPQLLRKRAWHEHPALVERLAAPTPTPPSSTSPGAEQAAGAAQPFRTARPVSARQRVRLAFADLKHRVCRPFSA